MPMAHPPGKHVAVSIAPDFDAHSVWMGTFGSTSPSLMSRGEFGAEVGVPRLLELFSRHDIRTTFFVPTHTMRTFPAATAAVVAAGHEIGAHGVYHEPVPTLEPDEERRLLELQVDIHREVVGRRPVGYRSPAFDFSPHTLVLLEECGFVYDSSLMGRDFELYRPRQVISFDREAGNTFGSPSPVIEVPVSWHLDDFPAVELLPRGGTLGSANVVYERWKAHFDFVHDRTAGGVLAIAVHPQTIGRAHMFLMLERFIDYARSRPGVYFAAIEDIVATYTD